MNGADMDCQSTQSAIQQALTELACGVFVLTAHHEGKRAGIIARSVQQCANEPLLICVAIRSGHWIVPIIRDSHCFAVSRACAADVLLIRKFSETARPRDGDPFDCIPAEHLQTGSPILRRASLALDCEVVRHVDIEADHEIYVGRVMAARSGAGSAAGSGIRQEPTAPENGFANGDGGRRRMSPNGDPSTLARATGPRARRGARGA